MQQEADMTEIEADNTLKELGLCLFIETDCALFLKQVSLIAWCRMFLDVLKFICDEKEESLTRQIDIHDAEVVSGNPTL